MRWFKGFRRPSQACTMGRICTVICIVVTMLLLILLLQSTTNNNQQIHRRLRLNSTTLSASHHQHANDNLTNTIVRLFPQIDVDPTDWFVSLHELTQWNLQQAQREFMQQTKMEMIIHDKNHDGYVSFSEYSLPTWLQTPDGDSFGYDMSWWKEEHFNASDADGNGLLNLAEFNDFLHPADSNNPKLRQWLCKAEIRERDMDRDGKVNFKEFFHGLFDLVRNYDEESYYDSSHSNDSKDASARVLFAKLDKDGDGYLSDIELLPIIGKLHPSGHYYAKQQAEYLISQAEVDKDGRLTLTEMIENPYVFYSAIFNNDKDEME